MKGVIVFGAALILAAGAAAAQERQALLIGNAAYRNAPEAQTAVRDVRSVADALRQAGWEVSVSVNLNRAEMRKALKSFSESTADAEDILIYFSGHALRTGGRTYLAPVDQEAGSLVDVLFGGVPLELVLRIAEDAPGEGVVFLDGAQLEGFEPAAFVEPGLAAVEPPEGVAVVSAAPPGQAIRRSPDRDSRFARLVVDRFLAPGAEVMATADEIGGPTWVAGETGDRLRARAPARADRRGQSRRGDRARLLAHGRAVGRGRGLSRIPRALSGRGLRRVRPRPAGHADRRASHGPDHRPAGPAGQTTGQSAPDSPRASCHGSRRSIRPMRPSRRSTSAASASARCSNGCAPPASSQAASTG